MTVRSCHVDVLVKGLTFVFMSTASDHTTSWDDACRLCQKVTQESHKRSGCRARGDGNHGKNGLFTLKTKNTHSDRQPWDKCAMFLFFHSSVMFKLGYHSVLRNTWKVSGSATGSRSAPNTNHLFFGLTFHQISLKSAKTENITSLVMCFFFFFRLQRTALGLCLIYLILNVLHRSYSCVYLHKLILRGCFNAKLGDWSFNVTFFCRGTKEAWRWGSFSTTLASALSTPI